MQHWLYFCCLFLSTALTAVANTPPPNPLPFWDPRICIDHNEGRGVCCRGVYVGNLELMMKLQGFTEFHPTDQTVNCIGVLGDASKDCPGINMCCQIRTATLPAFLALQCQKPPISNSSLLNIMGVGSG
ncbi:hypothetical protein BT63DRAFT_422885, partial [Microthyrium microscopicum]